MLADVFGPIRAAATPLLELEGTLDSDSDSALAAIAASFGAAGEAALANLVAAHERKPLPDAQHALVQVIELTTRIAARATGLS